MVSAIRLEGALVRRAGQRLLGPLDLALPLAGITMVLGPNGAGKTTLLRLLHGMERLAQGAVAVDVAAADQGFVFQRPTMMRRSVLDNLAYPLRLRGQGRGLARAEALVRLEAIGLGSKAGLEAHHLSGGERQKLALARALIAAPRLVFLDEPCASLDGASVRDIETMLQRARQEGVGAVMATHDLAQARRLADRVVLLHRGELIEQGPAAVFFAAPRTDLGRMFLRGEILE